jgi:hypothetical protein
MTKDERLEIAVVALTKIMQSGCACSMDYGSSCNCSAQDEAQHALQQICKHKNKLATQGPFEAPARIVCMDCHALIVG